MPLLPALSSASSAQPARRSGLTFTVLAASLMAVTGLAQAQVRYAVSELPVLPGAAQCTATGVNESSEVVGHCGPASDAWTGQTAVVWRQGTVVSLGKWSNGTYSMGTVINNVGRTAGHADTGNMRPQGWVTMGNGRWVNFFPNSSGNTYPQYLSDTGWIGGYYIKGSKGLWTGAIWTPDAKDPTRFRLTDLPQLPSAQDPASRQSVTSGFNKLGAAVGQAANDIYGGRAVLWRADARHTLEVLPDPAGGQASWASAINDLGQIVGVGGDHTPGSISYRAVLWHNDAAHTGQLLPNLPGDNSAMPVAINNLGQVLGNSMNYAPPGSGEVARGERPIVWRDGGVFELQSLLDPAAMAGMSLHSAAALNHRGQIAATALRNGLKRALLVTPLN